MGKKKNKVDKEDWVLIVTERDREGKRERDRERDRKRDREKDRERNNYQHL